MFQIRIIKSEGHIAELHSVTTDDYYILGLHRIRPPKPLSKTVLIMHGVQINSYAYVFPRSEHSLGEIYVQITSSPFPVHRCPLYCTFSFPKHSNWPTMDMTCGLVMLEEPNFLRSIRHLIQTLPIFGTLVFMKSPITICLPLLTQFY